MNSIVICFLMPFILIQISAQESRRKKKEYVDTLERQIAKYIDENGALKERVSTMEKNQR